MNGMPDVDGIVFICGVLIVLGLIGIVVDHYWPKKP